MDAFTTFLGCLPGIKDGASCCGRWHIAKFLAEWGAGTFVYQSRQVITSFLLVT